MCVFVFARVGVCTCVGVCVVVLNRRLHLARKEVVLECEQPSSIRHSHICLTAAMRRKRLYNAPLHRTYQGLGYCNQNLAKRVLLKLYEHISKRLELEEDQRLEQENREDEQRLERVRCTSRIALWKQNPISELHKERGCTILRGFSGEELFINNRNLKRIGTLRNFYLEVRTEFKLLPKHSLHLRFVGNRQFGRQWREHEVCCDESECLHYLRGSIIQSIVH